MTTGFDDPASDDPVYRLYDDRAEVLTRVESLTMKAGEAMTLPAVAHAAQVLRETGTPFSAIVIVTGRAIDGTKPVEGDLLPAILESGVTIHVVESRPSTADTAGLPTEETPDLLRVLADQTHGQYTTMREAVLAHAGEAAASSAAFRRLDTDGQNALIEFLKSLQILPPGTPCLVVDENYKCRER